MTTTNGKNATIAVTGSLAFDLIMDFPGHFKDHILPEKLHVINLSFLVEDVRQHRGGCAANIAYTLALLGEHPRVVGAAGKDFAEYESWLRAQGVDTGGVRVFSDEITASCYITTDRADNQITGFHPGAMKRAREISLRQSAGPEVAMVIVAPDDPQAMLRHCREAREMGVRLVYDPSFQVIHFDGPTLLEGAVGAYALILNDYEFAVFQEKTGRSRADLLRDVEMIVTTYGDRGSEIYTRDGATCQIPAAQAREVVDPTGAGDAFRGGFLAGLIRGLDLEVSGRMGSVAAAYAIEKLGTSNHAYSSEEFWSRYAENFGAALAPI